MANVNSSYSLRLGRHVWAPRRNTNMSSISLLLFSFEWCILFKNGKMRYRMFSHYFPTISPFPWFIKAKRFYLFISLTYKPPIVFLMKFQCDTNIAWKLFALFSCLIVVGTFTWASLSLFLTKWAVFGQPFSDDVGITLKHFLLSLY